MDEMEVAEQADLRAYLNVLSRRKLVIALCTLVVLALALAYSFVKTPVYTATATVLVPEQQASSALNIQNSQLPASDALIRALSDDQQFARGDSVKQGATKLLGYEAKASVGMSATSDVLTFTADSTDKQASASIANAYAKAFITARRDNQVAQYTQQITALQSSIAELQAKAAGLSPKDPQQAALQQSINSLSQSVQQTQATSQVAGQVGPTVIKAATVPTSPSSPKPIRNGALGLIVGLILGVGLAFVVERLDDGINSREAAEIATGGLPIVGLIPMVNSWKAKGSHHLALVEDPASNVSEAYRTLRTSIQFLSLDEPKHVIAITSSIPDEGKTTSVANLALSFARAGQRVIVVSCDLRRPKLHTFFGDNDRHGLTSLLLGDCSLADAVHPVEGEPRLRIMPSGPVPPNPAEILAMDRVREVIDSLVKNSDMVLLDCPPVLPITDTLLVSRLADGMLVLASTKTTSQNQLRRSVELLRQVHAPLIGTVLNRVPTENGYAYYGYSGSYDEVRPRFDDAKPTRPVSDYRDRTEAPRPRDKSTAPTRPTVEGNDQLHPSAAMKADGALFHTDSSSGYPAPNRSDLDLPLEGRRELQTADTLDDEAH